MKAVIQRVTRASVEVDGQVVGRIDAGLLVLLGVAKGDDETDGRYLAEKIRTLRIFSDAQGKMNRSLMDIGGSVLLVSQFTLLGRTTNGRRPSFDEAAPPVLPSAAALLGSLFEQPAGSVHSGLGSSLLSEDRWKNHGPTSARWRTSAILNPRVFGMCERWI